MLYKYKVRKYKIFLLFRKISSNTVLQSLHQMQIYCTVCTRIHAAHCKECIKLGVWVTQVRLVCNDTISYTWNLLLDFRETLSFHRIIVDTIVVLFRELLFPDSLTCMLLLWLTLAAVAAADCCDSCLYTYIRRCVELLTLLLLQWLHVYSGWPCCCYNIWFCCCCSCWPCCCSCGWPYCCCIGRLRCCYNDCPAVVAVADPAVVAVADPGGLRGNVGPMPYWTPSLQVGTRQALQRINSSNTVFTTMGNVQCFSDCAPEFFISLPVSNQWVTPSPFVLQNRYYSVNDIFHQNIDENSPVKSETGLFDKV